LPPWAGPPENELGVETSLRVLLARTDELALSLSEVIAYSTGFTLRLGLRIHPASDVDPRVVFRQAYGTRAGGGDDHLRFGVEFSDGRTATNQRMRRPPGEEEQPISLIVRSGGGGGGGLSYELDYWVYPLPTPGRLTVAAEWPARGLADTRHDVDADVIIQAAAASTELWEDNRPVGRRPPPSTGEIRIA
jgi:hypothetical protein